MWISPELSTQLVQLVSDPDPVAREGRSGGEANGEKSVIKRFLFLAIVVGLAACGPDDHLTVSKDAGTGSDGGPAGTTLTSYVIDLVNNHTSDTAPRPYTDFGSLPDPDGDTNNTAAYRSLFP